MVSREALVRQFPDELTGWVQQMQDVWVILHADQAGAEGGTVSM